MSEEGKSGKSFGEVGNSFPKWEPIKQSGKPFREVVNRWLQSLATTGGALG